MMNLEDDLERRMVAAKLARIANLGRKVAESNMHQSRIKYFSRLAQQCDEIDRFIASGCLEFGLDIMRPIIYSIILEYRVNAETVADILSASKNQDMKSSLHKSINICEDILQENQNKLH